MNINSLTSYYKQVMFNWQISYENLFNRALCTSGWRMRSQSTFLSWGEVNSLKFWLTELRTGHGSFNNYLWCSSCEFSSECGYVCQWAKNWFTEPKLTPKMKQNRSGVKYQSESQVHFSLWLSDQFLKKNTVESHPRHDLNLWMPLR